MKAGYRHDLDLLKGVAIIAVMLYHAGVCKSGYLGVDVFLVVSGYLTVPRVVGDIDRGRFRYSAFMERRVFRLLPLVLLVSAVALLIGYVGMLPGDYRYLCEEATAASVFAANVLQAVTTQNYWAAIYHKVLMHTWYLGVLMQFYAIFPLLMLLARKRMRLALTVLTAVSLALYLLPVDSIGNKYYLLPYRFFELSAGGLLALGVRRQRDSMSIVALMLLSLTVFLGAFTIGERAMPYNLVGGANTIRESFLPREVILLFVVGFTLLYLYASDHEGRMQGVAARSRVLAPLGRMSLSLFLWHQPIFAYYRYFYADDLSWMVLMVSVAVVILLSMATYLLMEKRIRVTRVSRICLSVVFIAVNGFALKVWLQGGAVRDVPELDIRKGEADPSAFERYTDRIYQYDRDFVEAGSGLRVLVVGNSFARDFANILLESPDSSRIRLSYHYGIEDCPLSRVSQCDRLYFFGWKHQVPDAVRQNLKPGAQLWGIGTKNHGSSNGIFYKNRWREDYLQQRTPVSSDFRAVNRLMKEEWGRDRFVDLMSLTMQADGTVAVFTPDGHFITYDGKHLTPAGTRYYAELLSRGSAPPGRWRCRGGHSRRR